MNIPCEEAKPSPSTTDDRNEKSFTWHRLGWSERLAVVVMLATVTAVTLPRLPPGICYDDSGDLQLAAATLGIMHPPGYPGYTTLGHLATLVPGVDPAYLVTLACLASGLIALVLCTLLQIRLGVHAFVASALALVLTSYPRIWSGLLVPEVYMPTLAFVAGGVYLLARYAMGGRRRDLFWSALLLGVALANRPPVFFLFPFILWGGWLGWRRWESGIRRAGRSLLLAMLVGALPAVYAAGYLWVRDRADTAYNYLDTYNAETHELPQASAGAAAKWQRIVWLTSGRQFHDLMGNDWPGVAYKLRWLHHELLPNRLITMLPGRSVVYLVGLFLVLVGLWYSFRRCPAAACLLIAMAVGSTFFVCLYRIYGDAADIRPLLFAIIVLTGVALSKVFPRSGSPWRTILATTLLVTMCVVTVMDAPNRRRSGRPVNANPFLKDLGLASLPKDSVICSTWPNATPLWYAQRVLTPRPDILILCGLDRNWKDMIADRFESPVFSAVSTLPQWKGYDWVRWRNLWKLTRRDQKSKKATPHL